MSEAEARPLISIVTVCFNSERHLAQAMESVARQTYDDIEYIVVDGNSSDGTLDIIRSFEGRFGDRLRWISEPDDGIYDAMNKGIGVARGELVGLLNSDDAYAPDAVERIVSGWLRAGRPSAIYGDVEVMDEAGVTVRLERASHVGPGDFPREMPMCHQSLFVTADTYARLGGFDTRYRILGDYEFLLRMVRAKERFARIDGPVARFRLGGACNSNTLDMNREREDIRVSYGASKIVERLIRLKHAFNMRLYRCIYGR